MTTEITDSEKFEVIYLPPAGGNVVCLWAPVSDFTHTLTREEAESVMHAVSKRKHTYSTGRWLARRALSRLSGSEGSILSGPRREPLWPDGMVGSITHTDSYAAVAVATSESCLSIGIDMESMGRLESKLYPRILTERELADLGAVDPTLIFSAKEACYKMLYPLFGRYVGFLDVEITVDVGDSSFAIRYQGESPDHRIVERAAGLFRQVAGHWLTFVVLKA